MTSDQLHTQKTEGEVSERWGDEPRIQPRCSSSQKEIAFPTLHNQTANLHRFNFRTQYHSAGPGPALFSHFKNTAFAHFWKSLDCHIHRGPICQLLECGSTKTLSCIRRIAECSPEYSGFSKYLTIPLNRIKSQPPVHLLIFRNVIISSGLIWNELFIQTD